MANKSSPQSLITPELFDALNTLAVAPAPRGELTPDSYPELLELRVWINKILDHTHGVLMDARKQWMRKSDELHALQNSKSRSQAKIDAKASEVEDWHAGYRDSRESFLEVMAFEEIMRVLPEVFNETANDFEVKWFIATLNRVACYCPNFPKFV